MFIRVDLPEPGRPDDREELAVVDDQVDAVEGADVDPPGLVDPADPARGR